MTDDPRSELQSLRERIDRCDRELLRLLAERARVALEIGHIKQAHGLPIYDPERERSVLDALAALNDGPLSDQAVRLIFQQVIRACRNLEQPPRIAFLGPCNTFSHQAVLDYFGPEVELAPQAEFADVAEAVARGEVEAGVLPVENALEGFIGTTFDLVVEHELQVVGEVIVPVELYLLSNVENLEDVRVVYSHAQPLRQARQWLRAHLNGVPLVTVESTAAAAERAASEQGAAAIAGPLVVAAARLPVLAGPVEDRADNRTRFWVVGREPAGQGDKTALMLVLPHEPGSLARALQVFAEYELNLTQIDSRPARSRPWEYRFFVEMQGNAQGERESAALQALQQSGVHARILGVFSAAAGVGDDV
ncbi:MAG: prephenate dehydratase [Candidatus Dadabacteria bacterium]|nr:MAG: prephenate dehydratase [Candidatus Dadabacteria bacterium]